MAWLSAAERRLPIQGLNPHAAHQGRHPSPANGATLLPQEIAQHAGAGKWILQMPLVDPAHPRAPSLIPALSGSKRSSGPVSAAGIVAEQAVDGYDRSWRCDPQARRGERPSQKIIL